MPAQPGRRSGSPSSWSTIGLLSERVQALAVKPFGPGLLTAPIEEDDGGDSVGIKPLRELEVGVEVRRLGEMKPLSLGGGVLR